MDGRTRDEQFQIINEKNMMANLRANFGVGKKISRVGENGISIEKVQAGRKREQNRKKREKDKRVWKRQRMRKKPSDKRGKRKIQQERSSV